MDWEEIKQRAKTDAYLRFKIKRRIATLEDVIKHSEKFDPEYIQRIKELLDHLQNVIA